MYASFLALRAQIGERLSRPVTSEFRRRRLLPNCAPTAAPSSQVGRSLTLIAGLAYQGRGNRWTDGRGRNVRRYFFIHLFQAKVLTSGSGGNVHNFKIGRELS